MPEATKRKLVSLYSFEFLIVAELMGSCHAESPKGSKLTLLLNSVNCVCQPVLLSVALWLDSHRLLLLGVIFILLGWLSLSFWNRLNHSLRISRKGDSFVGVGVVAVVLIEGGEFCEDELICAG